MKMSPTGAGRAPGAHDTTAGCVLARMATRSCGTLTSEVEPVQFGRTVTGFPAAAVRPAWIATEEAIRPPELMEGRFETCATPIRTPFTPGAPAVSCEVSASYDAWNWTCVLRIPAPSPGVGTMMPLSPA